MPVSRSDDFAPQEDKGQLAVSDQERLNSIKHHLAVWIRQGKHRVPFEPEYPNRWWCGGVVDPRSGKYFTHAGAWDFIAEQLEEAGTRITEVPLHKPPGKKAYVLKIPTRDGTIYVKIHFGLDEKMVVGRSFHYSEHG